MKVSETHCKTTSINMKLIYIVSFKHLYIKTEKFPRFVGFFQVWNMCMMIITQILLLDMRWDKKWMEWFWLSIKMYSKSTSMASVLDWLFSLFALKYFASEGSELHICKDKLIIWNQGLTKSSCSLNFN